MKQLNKGGGSVGNNQNSQTIGAIVKGLLVLAIVIVLIALGLSILVNSVASGVLELVEKLTALDVTIVVALFTGFVSILTVVLGAIVNNVLSNRHRKQEYLRNHREEPYTQLVAMYYKMLSSSKAGNAYSEEEMINDIMQFNQGLTLWGSSKAIKKWDKWRLLSTRPPVNPIDVMHGMEDVLIQLRKDMGERESLKRGDILKLTINDYDESIGGKK